LIRVLALLSFVGCSVDYDDHPGERCTTDTDCSDGRICYGSFCIRACIDGTACFYGPPEAIRDGTTACREGICQAALGQCLGQVVPHDELCNEIDDDCDGNTDEVPDMTCSTGLAGVCGEGAFQCVDGRRDCVPMREPSDDVCDGADNDCDEKVDEGTSAACYPEAVAGCTATADGFDCIGACAPGSLRCGGGVMSEECDGAVVPAAAEVCTMPDTVAADENCNGLVDEECPCTESDLPRSCYTGPGSVAGVGACTVGIQTCDTAMGVWGECEDSVLPTAETCDNPESDDDCNGTVDDIPMLGAACTDSGQMGACSAGLYACEGGALVCDTPDPASSDPCDGADNDCNGTVDDGIDLTRDPLNCGRCGETCEGGACCGSACTNTSNDPLNCGMCGMRCASGQACCGGMCVAPGSSRCLGCEEDCEAMGRECCGGTCVDSTRDENNCGGCGRTCSGENDVCCGGTCVSGATNEACGTGCDTCDGAEMCCGGSCVGPTTAHCTSCDACPATGPNCCPDTGGCTDRLTDRNNCGACGTVCAAGEECQGGRCLSNCGGTWVDTDTNLRNCGRCGNVCMALPLGTCACRGGACMGLCIL
jgi:hypothetical protein